MLNEHYNEYPKSSSFKPGKKSASTVTGVVNTSVSGLGMHNSASNEKGKFYSDNQNTSAVPVW